MGSESRRVFLQQVGALAGSALLAPVISSCSRPVNSEPTTPPPGPAPVDALAVPETRPADWDPISFNRTRGDAGAVPESFRASIDGDDGAVGKHLPYMPAIDAALVPEGFVAIMFGDPASEYPRHPAAAPAADGTGGHWFNRIRVRKAVAGPAGEIETTFSSWPETAEGDSGQYAVLGGGDVTAESGVNTVYLVRLPSDVSPGDPIRVFGHCTLHGEYVDFLDR